MLVPILLRDHHLWQENETHLHSWLAWHSCLKLIPISHCTGPTLKTQKGNPEMLLCYHSAKPLPDNTGEPGHWSYHDIMVPIITFVTCFSWSILHFSVAFSIQKCSAELSWMSYGQSALGHSEVGREESLPCQRRLEEKQSQHLPLHQEMKFPWGTLQQQGG